MKSRLSLFLILSGFIFIAGCKGKVGIIQDSAPSNFPTITYQDLFDKHFEFEKTEWNEFSTDRNEKVVEFTGYMKPSKACVNRRFVAQFIFDAEGKNFKPTYFGVKYNPANEMAVKVLDMPRDGFLNLNPGEVIYLMYNKNSILYYDDIDELLARTHLFQWALQLDTKSVDYCLSLIKTEKFTNINDVSLKDIIAYEKLVDTYLELSQDPNQEAKTEVAFNLCKRLFEKYPMIYNTPRFGFSSPGTAQAQAKITSLITNRG